jgi:cell division protein FtsB
MERQTKTLLGAVADVIAEQVEAREKAVTVLTHENETLASQIFDLQQQVGALVERLAQLEARPSGLRAVG